MAVGGCWWLLDDRSTATWLLVVCSTATWLLTMAVVAVGQQPQQPRGCWWLTSATWLLRGVEHFQNFGQRATPTATRLLQQPRGCCGCRWLSATAANSHVKQPRGCWLYARQPPSATNSHRQPCNSHREPPRATWLLWLLGSGLAQSSVAEGTRQGRAIDSCDDWVENDF